MDQRYLVFALVIVPVLSVCFGFTVHYVIRPMVETLVDAIHDLSRIMARSDHSEDAAALRREVDALRAEVADLKVARDFDRRLLGTAPRDERPREPTA